VDVTCRGCREPWDLYGLIHDERIADGPEALPGQAWRKASPDGGAFTFLALDGLDEAAEGALALLSCPACEENAPVGVGE